jgi:PEP-CTERM motif
MRIVRCFLPVVMLFLAPAAVFADQVIDVGQVVNLTSVGTSGDIVFCDTGVQCSATTPRNDIAGVAVFYLSLEGPFTPDVGPANELTLLGGSTLKYFLTNFPGGFSANAGFTDVGSNGKVTTAGFTFDTKSPTATPEPGTYMLLGIGLLGIACCAARFRTQVLG